MHVVWKSLRGENLGSSQAFSEHMFSPGHVCVFLDSQLYAGDLNVIIPILISPFLTFSCPWFTVYLLLLLTVISCSSFLWPIILPLLSANATWESTPAVGKLQVSWNKDKSLHLSFLMMPEWNTKPEFFESKVHSASFGISKPVSRMWTVIFMVTSLSGDGRWGQLKNHSILLIQCSSFFLH